MNLLMSNKMIMSSQYQINTFNILSQLDIIILHHMSKCDHHITFLFLSKFLYHLICEINEGNVFADLFVVRI